LNEQILGKQCLSAQLPHNFPNAHLFHQFGHDKYTNLSITAMSLIKAWCKRNIASEGLEIVTFEWKQGNLEIELKESEEDEPSE